MQVQLLVIQKKAVGGIIVTSSHNPVQWNGLKFVDSDGLFLAPDWCDSMFKLVSEDEKNSTASPFVFPAHSSIAPVPSLLEHNTAIAEHIDAIFALPYINAEMVQKKKFRVCIDAINGAGGACMTKLLDRFGCTVIGMNIEPTGIFAHEPEPIPENLASLCKLVTAEKADFGTPMSVPNDCCVWCSYTGPN